MYTWGKKVKAITIYLTSKNYRAQTQLMGGMAHQANSHLLKKLRVLIKETEIVIIHI